MEWHLNDLSLQGQFQANINFINSLEILYKLRHRYPFLQERLYCSRTLAGRPVVNHLSLRQVIGTLQNGTPQNKTLARLIMNWMVNSGPFWDDTREENPDDYFTYESEDVTDQGLGEAARRRLAATDARSLSFPGGTIPFTYSPLVIQQGVPEEPLGDIRIPNTWDWDSLQKELIAVTPSPQSWDEMLQQAIQRFPNLIFAQTIHDQLHPYPFSRYAAERFLVLLDILDKICSQTLPDGSMTKEGQQLNEYLNKAKSIFGDESETNKRIFKKEITFPDPLDCNATHIFCPWHGKVKSPNQYRIHFQWPRPTGQREIKVVYIGLKITRS
ncbi:MAG: hypothetical protein H7839_20830 [Magnetococcus sp. YQC-5]